MTKELNFTPETVNALRREGKTRQEIAETLGISLSKLKRVISDLDVVPRTTKAEMRRNQPRLRVREKAVFSNPEEGEGLMERASAILGPRMGERSGCYTLDGRPTSSWDILKAAGLQART